MAIAAGWLRKNLFSSPWNALLTVVMATALGFALVPLAHWLIFDATLSGSTKADCGSSGACWTFIKMRAASFFYGRYPAAERWRVDVAFVLFACALFPVLRSGGRHRGLWLAGLIVAMPIVTGTLLIGGVFGLKRIDTDQWGGLMLNVVISFATLCGALPLGILLAFGRRSVLPVVRHLSIGFIEIWRGVPLLTALFMGTVMLPLFLPGGFTVDNLARAIIALTLFTSAYVAEVIRGGIQAIARGQYEAAQSLGLSLLMTNTLVVLPQVMRLVVPSLVNIIIDLFKDTTLVSIVGLFDVLGTTNQAIKDQAWLGLAREGYVFAAAVFFVCCYAMSSYSRRLEARLSRARH
jgi:general L-amino acid transport system permease protein